MNQIVVIGANSQLGQTMKQLRPEWVYLNRSDLDLKNLNAIQTHFKNKADLIINFAAYTAVDLAETNRDEAYLLNCIVPGELALHCKNFIHISTDYVFDGLSQRPYLESDKTNPINYYGQTKRDGEILVLKNNLNSIVIRTSWLYSAFRVNFVGRMIELAKTKDELRIVNDQAGSPTNAEDLCLAINQVVEKMRLHEKMQMVSSESKLLGEIYHFSNEGECTWFEFAKEIFDTLEIKTRLIPIQTSEYPTAAVRPKRSVLSKEKFKSTFKTEIDHWQKSLNRYLSKRFSK